MGEVSSSRPTTNGSCIFAVIVTFNPDETVFTRLVDAVLKQAAGVIVVDNGSQYVDVGAICSVFQGKGQEIRFVPLGLNYGIAAAQNHGIKTAKAAGADYVLLLDHDSVPMDGMVGELLRTDRAARNAGIAVGAVGAVTIDRRTGTFSKILRAQGWRVLRLPTSPSDDCAEADFLVASGTMISMSILDQYGMMDESYFIDQVDTEWCFRIRAHGLRLLMVPRAHLEHSIGDKITRAWLFRWYEVPIHSPARDYYTFRNIIRLLLTVPMPRAWRAMYIYRLAQYGVFFGLGVSPRLQRLSLMMKGVVDGLLRKGGPLVERRNRGS